MLHFMAMTRITFESNGAVSLFVFELRFHLRFLFGITIRDEIITFALPVVRAEGEVPLTHDCSRLRTVTRWLYGKEGEGSTVDVEIHSVTCL